MASTRWPISSNERPAARTRSLKDGDRLDLDQELGLRQCCDRDQGARRHFLVLAEELLADRSVIGAVAEMHWRRYRVEVSPEQHSQIARRCLPELLAGADAQFDWRR